MGLLTFSINVTLDGCVDHQEGIAGDETHAFFTRLMDECGAMLWGRVTYEMMESYWPAVARGDVEAPPAIRAWAVKLEAKPKYVVSSTRKDFRWTNSHPIASDLPTGVQKLKDATPAGVLLGSDYCELYNAGPELQKERLGSPRHQSPAGPCGSHRLRGEVQGRPGAGRARIGGVCHRLGGRWTRRSSSRPTTPLSGASPPSGATRSSMSTDRRAERVFSNL